jgi:two-component system OmpR family sensor kinase
MATVANEAARSWKPRWSVRSRILAAILLVTALGMGVAGATAFFVQRERTLQEIDQRLLSRVESARFVVIGDPDSAASVDGATAAAADVPTFTGTRDALEAVLARVIPNRHESSLGIIDGVPAFVSGVELQFRLEDDPALIARVVSEVSDGSVRIGTALSPLGELRYIATPVDVAGSAESGIYLVAVNVESELAELHSAFSIFAVVAGASLVVIGLVGWFVAGRLLSPIRSLRRAASRITANELHERIPVVGNDDVSELTATINDMLERLDLALTGQRQLLDDVRHELKTPITILRGHLELLDSADSVEVDATRALAIDELDRMAGLVDDIEALAESHSSVPVRVLVDVADLTEEVFAKATGYSGREWKLTEVTHTIFSVDPARITQAWLQLIDNAVKYSPDGSRIEIGSHSTDESVQLWVSDNGPGIPDGAEERIFERFGRADTGRGIRGSGLGLPIVNNIALSHGGRVTLESTAAGSRFAIIIPVDEGDRKVARSDAIEPEHEQEHDWV